MFKKLVSELPFQPNLLGSVVFYLHRVRQEEQLRRVGLVLTALVIVLQMFAIISPAKPSLATSTGDIVYGATSREDVLKAYKNNRDQLGRKDIQAIFNHYGIGADQIANAKLTQIKDSTSKDYINTSRSTTKYVDTFIPIKGAEEGGIYEFPLLNWRKGEYPNGYPALTGMSTYGFRFWILLKGCGNIVFEKGAKKPLLDITKERATASSTKPGASVNYTLQFRNKGAAIAEGVTIYDRLPADLTYQSYSSNIDLSLSREGQLLKWKIKNKGSSLAPSTRWFTITVKTLAKPINAASVKACNIASIDAQNAGKVTANDSEAARCVKIVKPVCPGTGLPIPPGGVSECSVTCPDGKTIPYNKSCPVPQLSCQDLEITGEPAWNTRKFQTTVLLQPGATLKQVNYFVNDAKVQSVPAVAGSTSQSFTYTFPRAGDYKIRAELEAANGTVQPSSNCVVEETIVEPITPEAKLSTDKAVSNLTQKIADANNTTAKAGDVLKYSVFVSNTGNAPATVELKGEYGESIADILEYANLTDKGDATFNEETGFLSWGAVTIQPNQKVEKNFTVTIKNPIPATPVSASNPLSFDYVLHNKYGREVNVLLDKPASKVVEQAATTLPNTGPSASMLLTIVATIVISYFFYRSRLMARELEIVHHEYSTGGI